MTTQGCNIQYNSDNDKKKLKLAIDIAWRKFNRQNDLDAVLSIKDLFSDSGNQTQISNTSDEVKKEFLNDLVESIDNCAKDSDKAKLFKNAVLGTFFDLNTVTEYLNNTTLPEMEGVVLERSLTEYDAATEEVYGTIRLGLVSDVKQYFKNDLLKETVIDTVNWVRHSLNTALLNSKIIQFKEKKLLNLVKYLKEIYKNDNEKSKALSTINSLYSAGNLNAQALGYTLKLFKEYLDSKNNLNFILREELRNRDKKNKELITVYQSLVNELLKDSSFKSWFNRTFNTVYQSDLAKRSLFVGNRHSTYFLKIKQYIEEAIRTNTPIENKETIVGYLLQILYPTGGLLNYVHDYFILSHFDDVLNDTLGDRIKIKKGFIKNSEPSLKNSKKYQIVESKKHQNSGWENSDKEDATTHTSASVKEILEYINRINYKTGEIIPEKITITDLVNAWVAFLGDVLNDRIMFNTDRTFKVGNESLSPKEYFKYLLNTLQEDSVSNIIEIFQTLMGSESNKFKLLEQITSAHSFNESHKNVLYSFYLLVLNTEGETPSILTMESKNYKTSNKGLDIVSNLLSILNKNVNNRYVDCDLRSGKIAEKAKFNWDSLLFDCVERIQSNSKVAQNNPELLEDKFREYDFVSTNSEISITINGLLLKYTIGNNIYGIFSNANDLHIKAASKQFLDKLAKINLETFKNSILNNHPLNEDELALKLLLELFNYTLNQDMLSEIGLDTLIYYKNNYKADTTNKLWSANYLDNFLRIALRYLEASYVKKDLKDQNFRQYLEKDNNAKYGDLFKKTLKDEIRGIFEFLGPNVYMVVASTRDLGLANFVKARMNVLGQTSKATSRNHQGATVSNNTVSRAGSVLNQRLHDEKKTGGVYSGLIFVNNPSLIDTDPIIDSEIINLLGEPKAVTDMSPSELIQHAMIDKFYSNYILHDKVLFQPTTYADKTQFLNYFAKLHPEFGEDAMNLFKSISKTAIKLQRESFFYYHSLMFINSLLKLSKLYKFVKNTETNSVDDVNNFLKEYTADELILVVANYNKANPDDYIELEEEKDYRYDNGYCTINESLHYYNTLYNDENKLELFILSQLDLFIEDLKRFRISFKLFDFESELEHWVNTNKIPDWKMSPLQRVLHSGKLLNGKTERDRYVKEWVSESGELILKKEDGIVNPLIEKFFYIEGLYSNNLRLSLTGSEVNHADKSFNLFKEVRNASKEYLKNKTNEQELLDILTANSLEILNIDEFATSIAASTMYELSKSDEGSVFKKIYNASILSYVNTAQGTLYKRNVIVPATLVKFSSGLIEGVSAKVKAAIIRDEKAPVNNLRYSDRIDSLDGGAHLSPILLRLENKSLGDGKVGLNRKPIWDDLSEFGTEFLAKFAAFAPNNALLLQELLSQSSGFRLFKKMHNLRWNGSINLTHNIFGTIKQNPNLNFVNNWFKSTILEGQRLFYKNQFGLTVEIVGFGQYNGNYYTEESIGGKVDRVYHYFSDLGSVHYTEKPQNIPVHTIDSLYELFLALGGVNCINGDYTPSDFSLDVLTNFVNNVGHKLVTGNPYLAKHVSLPLKDKFIAYTFNQTCIKEGAKNINPVERWHDDSELITFEVNTKGLGIQLNAGKDIVDSTLSEFSLVIAACAAYGKDFKSVNELFFGLGLSAFQESHQELEYVLKFLKDTTKDPKKALYNLYKIIGKLVVKSNSNSDYDLTNLLKLLLKHYLNMDKDAIDLDDLKVPFSDPSLYMQFITALTSVINKKSIKRRHPGAGYVMAPSYNKILYFLLYDKKSKTYRKYMFLDLLKRASKEFKGELFSFLASRNVESINGLSLKYCNLKQLLDEAKRNNFTSDYLNSIVDDVTLSNINLVNTYLKRRQNKEFYRTQDWFMPTDIVLITYPDKRTEVKDLSDMKDFYDFKNKTYPKGTRFLLDVTKPNNLKPSLMRWRYLEDEKSLTELQITKGPDYRKVWKEDLEKPEVEQRSNTAFMLYLNEDSERGFEIVKDLEAGFWSIHFKTIKEGETFENAPKLTDELKERLFQAAVSQIPTGEYLSTWGELTPGGISGINRLINYGFLLTGWRLVSDRDGNLINIPILLKVGKFMTIYDHPIVSSNWNKPKNERPKQAEIQKVLDGLDSGIFYKDGKKYNILKGSLENTAAELVLGNMYKDMFGVKNESLADILDLGEEFFKKDIEIPQIPAGIHRLAFVKNNGTHVLISFEDGLEDSREFKYKNETYNLVKDPFDNLEEKIDEKNPNVIELYDKDTGIKIGRFIKRNDWKWVDNHFEDAENNVVDESKYKKVEEGTGNFSAWERFEYVQRFKYNTPTEIDGERLDLAHTLYNFSSTEEIAKSFDFNYLALSQEEQGKLKKDARKQIASILNNIYDSDSFINLQINYGHPVFSSSDRGDMRFYDNVLSILGSNMKMTTKGDSSTYEELTEEEIEKLPLFRQHMIRVRSMLNEGFTTEDYQNLLKEYYTALNEPRRKWSSFLSSLLFISSRIPAQSLQSFMAMQCVGWTSDTENTAYVSYILTFLLGSDY